MEPAVAIALGVGFLLLLWVGGTYNGLVRLRNHVKEAFSGVDTELKRRHELIPNLVETVKGYAAHEKTVLEQLVLARQKASAVHGGTKDMARDENAFASALRQVFVVAEGYPDLKAHRNFLALQRELANTEDRIQSSRRFYNANVRDLNNRVETFPSNLLASAFGFQRADHLELEDVAMRATPEVKL